ncbi:hypothetical protein CJ030_MR0G008646 [Morella rubra]|uniref:Uncharacterized protein n=1 Tax=Morella rubra TaxID=262757 RepID=A0A6A1ULJ1_9ROSI|nr:hypothetical protein CJ030_MR0G008646 [Morella rubra]
MPVFNSFVTHDMIIHTLIIHIRALVTDGLEVIVDCQPYVILKDLPPDFSWENGPVGEYHSHIDWVDLTGSSNDEGEDSSS